MAVVHGRGEPVAGSASRSATIARTRQVRSQVSGPCLNRGGRLPGHAAAPPSGAPGRHDRPTSSMTDAPSGVASSNRTAGSRGCGADNANRDCRDKQEPVATSRDFLEAQILQRSEMVTPGSHTPASAASGSWYRNEARCRPGCMPERTAASAFSGQQHRLSSGAVPKSRLRPGWSDRAAADLGCWDQIWALDIQCDNVFVDRC